jgi:hypothetical protein
MTGYFCDSRLLRYAACAALVLYAACAAPVATLLRARLYLVISAKQGTPAGPRPAQQ